MVEKRTKKSALRVERGKIRISIGFSPDIHDTLEKIAKNQKVSLGWVVREAVDHYMAEKWPLFARGQS
jgi:predicted transcriptional regulator